MNRVAAGAMTATCRAVRTSSRSLLAAVIVLACAIGWHGHAAAQSKMLVYNPPPPNIAQGSTQLLPGGGFDASITNYKPYALPGQNEDPSKNPCNGQVEYVPGDPFALSCMPIPTSAYRAVTGGVPWRSNYRAG
jgi:hypothetical protein